MVGRQVELVVFEFFRHGLLVHEDLVTYREHGVPVALGLRQADLRSDVRLMPESYAALSGGPGIPSGARCAVSSMRTALIELSARADRGVESGPSC